jgi:hypothetical protein
MVPVAFPWVLKFPKENTEVEAGVAGKRKWGGGEVAWEQYELFEIVSRIYFRTDLDGKGWGEIKVDKRVNWSGGIR